MKRLVVMFLVAVMVIVAIPFGSVFAANAEAVMEATIWEDFSRSDAGGKFGTTELYSTDELATWQCVNTLGALGGVNAAKLNYTEEFGYYVKSNNGFSVVYDEPKSMKGIDYMMYYVKLPISAAKDEKTENWMNMTIAIAHLTTSDEWVSSKSNMYCEVLAKNSSEWKSLKYNSAYIYLPAGFEGYIKVPMTNYKLESFKYPFEKYKIKETIFKFSKMGGDLGPAYVNAIYAGTKDADSIKIKLNGEKTARYLTTGLTDADLAPKKALIDSAMKATVIQDFSSYSLGETITKTRAFVPSRKEDVTGTVIENPFGLASEKALKLSSPTLGGFMDVNPIAQVMAPAFIKMDDMKSILLYVKCGEHHPLDSARAGISLTLYTSKGGKNLWPQMGDGKAQYLEKGTNQWFTPQTDTTGRIYLPDKFEGYVMVDLTEMLKNSVYNDLEDRTFRSANIGLSAIGGECGDVYIGGIYAITEKVGKTKTLITFNDCDVYDLSTGGIATGQPSEVKNIEVGDVLTGFPATTDKTYKGVPEKTTQNTLQLSWSEHPKAQKYKIEVYATIKDNEADATYYECVASNIVDAKDGLKSTVEGLTPATRYFLLVYALTASEETIDVYEIARFSTRIQSGSSNSTQQVVLDNTDDTVQDDGLGILLYVIIGGAVLLVAAATVVTLIIIKKKRKTKLA